MNDVSLNNLKAKQIKFKEMQDLFDEVIKQIIQSNKPPPFFNYAVNTINKNKLTIEIFGISYYIIFENLLSKGTITYTKIDNEDRTGEILETITINHLGNLSEPHSQISTSNFLNAHYHVLNDMTNYDSK